MIPAASIALGSNVTTHSKGVTPDNTTRPTPSTCDSGVETWAVTYSSMRSEGRSALIV